MASPLRIATTKQLHRSAREAGFEAFCLPELPSYDFNRSLQQRSSDGPTIRKFLEENQIELVVDFNTEALTLVPSTDNPSDMMLATAAVNVPYVACYLDPVTSTMANVPWSDHWHILESHDWVKWIWETAHSDELKRLGLPNILTMSMAAANDDFNTSPLPDPDPGPVIAFMGHPASSWFKSGQTVSSDSIVPGLTAAAVHADMPDVAFHNIYYDLYAFAQPPQRSDSRAERAKKSAQYFNDKFFYNAYLAIKQRDRFAKFLQLKLGDAFELVGDHWGEIHGLKHTPRIWDMKQLHERMRRVPICLNLMKGCLESGLNIRHFEITSYGGFMLTYETPELAANFEIGKECDVFHDEQELLEKIRYYLAHDKERREIAAAGQRRTLKQHLYSHRFQTLVGLLQKAGMIRSDEHAPVSQAVSSVSTSAKGVAIRSQTILPAQEV